MSRYARRLLYAHTSIAITSIVACTLLASLGDIPGSTAVMVILSVAGISGSGTAAATAGNRSAYGPVVARARHGADRTGGQ